MLSEAPAWIRRLLRFIALPYCYYSDINWNICTQDKTQVIKDFLYIYFRLKYYPDNYFLCKFWLMSRKEWKYYYGSVYDALQRKKLRKEVFPLVYRIIYDDKMVSHQLCYANKLQVPAIFSVIDDGNYKEQIKQLTLNNPDKKYIVKPIAGRGGNGIHLLYIEDDQVVIQDKFRRKTIEQFILSGQAIVQEYVQQHPALDRISCSVNTIRIVTMLTRDKTVLILGAFMRFGVGNAFLDNTSQGGIKVGVQIETGEFKGLAYDKKGIEYTEHPTSRFRFEGFKIPFWKEVIALAEDAQRTLSYNKLLGQDIAVTEEGPVLIELNAEYDNAGLEQVCGPILKNPDVLKAFNEYNLLVNKYQRELLMTYL